MAERRVIVILGCTASGKGSLARALARALSGEILSIDSMKVYRGMDIGTAKPSPQVRAEIPHHLIDVADVQESFSAARFVELADAAVGQVHARGRPVVAVGGTVLYFKCFYEGLFEGPSADQDFRRRLRERAEREGTAALHAELARVDPVAAERIHPNDYRRIERALEVYHLTGTPISQLQRQWERQLRRPEWQWILLGVRRDRDDNARRINRRVKRMVQQGLVEEARRLWDDPRGISPQARQAVGYAELFDAFEGRWPIEHAIEQIKIHTRQLARQQRTWLRRQRAIRWLDAAPDQDGADLLDAALHLIDGASGSGVR